MPILYPVLAAVLALRLAELIWSWRNERRLLVAGGLEVGRRHYPLFFAVHESWLLTIALFADPVRISWPWLLVFACLQGLRFWVIASLGHFWTTRIITLPKAPLVRRGPYRYLNHPNYLIVAAEIAALPLAFGAWALALIFSVLNGLLLWHRIRIEDEALAPRRKLD